MSQRNEIHPNGIVWLQLIIPTLFPIENLANTSTKLEKPKWWTLKLDERHSMLGCDIKGMNTSKTTNQTKQNQWDVLRPWRRCIILWQSLISTLATHLRVDTSTCELGHSLYVCVCVCVCVWVCMCVFCTCMSDMLVFRHAANHVQLAPWLSISVSKLRSPNSIALSLLSNSLVGSLWLANR